MGNIFIAAAIVTWGIPLLWWGASRLAAALWVLAILIAPYGLVRACQILAHAVRVVQDDMATEDD